VINLETGIQEAGDTVNYQSLNDGVDTMEELALKLTGQETREAEAAKTRAEQEAAKARTEQEAARARAAQAAAAAAQSATTPVVSDAASFTQAIASINNNTASGQYTITLTNNVTSGPVTFTNNATKTITIKGDAVARTISNNGGGPLFTVPKGITLVLENNITLNGNNQKNSLVYVDGGTLSMNAGSTIRGAQDSGVRVYGTFTMSGGTISGNSASQGGGVFVNGTFTMSGGTISGNSTSATGFAVSIFDVIVGGGGVFVEGGTFRMSGGSISGNSAKGGGGGVGVNRGATFVKSGGGTIDNTNSGVGRVAYLLLGFGARQRNSTAGPGVNIDTGASGSKGGWE
jgi:hypothetical protein